MTRYCKQFKLYCPLGYAYKHLLYMEEISNHKILFEIYFVIFPFVWIQHFDLKKKSDNCFSCLCENVYKVAHTYKQFSSNDRGENKHESIYLTA